MDAGSLVLIRGDRTGISCWISWWVDGVSRHSHIADGMAASAKSAQNYLLLCRIDWRTRLPFHIQKKSLMIE
jgi:hypothetical protein